MWNKVNTYNITYKKNITKKNIKRYQSFIVPLNTFPC